MKATGSNTAESPLAGMLRAHVERVLQSWEASGTTPGDGPGKLAVRRFLAALDEVARSADGLAGPAAGPAGVASIRPGVLAITEDLSVAAGLRLGLGPSWQVDVVSTAQDAQDSAAERDPAVLFAAGRAAGEAVERVRETFPGIPAVIAAAQPEVAALLARFRDDPAVILPLSVGVDGFTAAVRALLELLTPREREPADLPGALSATELFAEPKSYAHLTGLLPRALERSVDFDVGAAVIARPGAEPLVDVYATSDCSPSTLELVRERALALFSIVSGRAQAENEEVHVPVPPPLRSSIYVPLATEGRVVGLTYLGSFRPDAFSGRGEVIAELAANASGAYRRLEASVNRLRLTPRQSQVLALIASGLSDREVAERLGLAHRTVRTHIDRMLREHGLRSRTEAVAAWLRGQQD
jgi:DNA-binding NarL/FixJ family response regulator